MFSLKKFQVVALRWASSLVFLAVSTKLFGHPENPALLEAVLASPEDDLPRLVYADWLTEHGDEVLATFIRASIFVYREEEKGGPQSNSDWENYIILRAAREAAWRELKERFQTQYPDVWVEMWHFGRGFAGEISWWELTQVTVEAETLDGGDQAVGKYFSIYRNYPETAGRLQDVYFYRGGEIDVATLKKCTTIHVRADQAASLNQALRGLDLAAFKFKNLIFASRYGNGTGVDAFDASVAEKFERLYLSVPAPYHTSVRLHANMKNLRDLRSFVQPILSIDPVARHSFPHLGRLTLHADTPAFASREDAEAFREFLLQAKELRHIGLRFNGSQSPPLVDQRRYLDSLPDLLRGFDSLAVVTSYFADPVGEERVIKSLMDIAAKNYSSYKIDFTGYSEASVSKALQKIRSHALAQLKNSKSLCSVLELAVYRFGAFMFHETDLAEARAYFEKNLRGFTKPGVNRITIALNAQATLEVDVKKNREAKEIVVEQNPSPAACPNLFAATRLGRWFWGKFLQPKPKD